MVRINTAAAAAHEAQSSVGRSPSSGSRSSLGRASPASYSAPSRAIYSRPSFRHAEKCVVVCKINQQSFDALSADDFQEIFDILAQDNKGSIRWTEIAKFLQEVLDPPFTETEIEAISRFTGVQKNGMVSAEQLRSAFDNSAIRIQLKQLKRIDHVNTSYLTTQGVGAEISRDLLVERLDWQVRKDDAFATLPFSLIFTILFISLVILHLQVWQRQQVQRGLQSWIEGYGAGLSGPFLKEVVAGTSSCWSWLSSSGILALFGECGEESGGTLCRLATQNVLIGDAELRQDRADGPAKTAWLLGSDAAAAHLAHFPADYLGAANETLQHLAGIGWVDDFTDSLELVFSTYNEDAHMFATTEVKVGFDYTGFVEPVVIASAVPAEPYPDWSGFVLDGLYIIAILYPLYVELKDLASWCRTVGCVKGIKSYSGFWNAMDWMNISMGFVQSLNWVLCCFAIQAYPLQSLLEGESGAKRLNSQVMGLDREALDTIRNDLAYVINLFFLLHVIMAVNVFSIMIKFFKAFQANPRLQLVTNTLTHAANDIFHFCVVAFAVFVGYAAIGHILFGGDIVAFNSLRRSMNTVFIVLMGEFAWYSQESTADRGLGSGMPWILVALWFWSFMVLCFLVLTNMLMAIILEHYADCFGEIKKDPDACTLWVQAIRFLRQQLRGKKQGFLSQESLLCQLLDEADKVHPEDVVTEDSLCDAFNMPRPQAQLLAEWLGKEASRRMQKEGGQDNHFNIARLMQVEGFLEGLMEMLHITSLNVSQCCRALQESGPEKNEGMESAAQFARQVQEQTTNIEDLAQVASMLRDVVEQFSPKNAEGVPGVQHVSTLESSGLAAAPAAAVQQTEPPRQAASTSCCDVSKPETKSAKARAAVTPLSARVLPS